MANRYFFLFCILLSRNSIVPVVRTLTRSKRIRRCLRKRGRVQQEQTVRITFIVSVLQLITKRGQWILQRSQMRMDGFSANNKFLLKFFFAAHILILAFMWAKVLYRRYHYRYHSLFRSVRRFWKRTLTWRFSSSRNLTFLQHIPGSELCHSILLSIQSI